MITDLLSFDIGSLQTSLLSVINRSYIWILTLTVFISCKNKEQPKVIDLNGTWQFSTANTVSEEDLLTKQTAIDWDTLAVPANWDTRERYSTYRGKAFYKRDLEIPIGLKGKQLLLQFDAVYQTAKVWLNGKLLGEHIGGYTPFEFNISDLVDYGGQNELLVSADNTYHRGAWWPWGGISRDVRISIYDKIRLKHQHITASPNFETSKVYFALTYAMNNYEVTGDILLKSSITDAEGEQVWTNEQAIVSTKNSNVEKEITFTEELDKYALWHFDSPNLYQLTTKIIKNGKILDSLTDNFGVRKIEAKGEQLYLNNEVVYLDGFNRVHDHPTYGNTEPIDLVRSDMEDIKALGGRFSRLMHAPLAKSVLDYCDKNGYLLIQEIPVWGTDDPQSYPDNPQTKKWLTEMITRDYNHPSVVGWSVGNELRDSVNDWSNITLTKAQFGYINSMLDHVAQLDSTRLKTYVSLTSYKEKASLENEPFDKMDLLCLNSYGDAVAAVKNTHEKFPGKPFLYRKSVKNK